MLDEISWPSRNQRAFFSMKMIVNEALEYKIARMI